MDIMFYERGQNHIKDVIKPFRFDSQFGSFLDPKSKKIGSLKGRGYCLLQITLAPGRFVLNTLQRVVDVARAIFNIARLFIKNGFALMSNILAGNPEGEGYTSKSYRELKENSKVIVAALGALAISPFALVAEEVRLVIGVVNPALAFRDRSYKYNGEEVTSSSWNRYELVD